MSDIARLDGELNEMILSGKALDGFEKFYSDARMPTGSGRSTSSTRSQSFTVAKW